MNRFFAAVILTGLILAPNVRSGAQGISVDSASCLARAAVTPAPRGTDSARGPVSRDSAMAPAVVMLFASATAREVTFAKAPEVRVTLCGGLDSLRVVERRNLPNPVVAGRTYRDVYVAVEIFGRLNADCVVAAITSAPGDSTGRRNACASLEIGGTRTRPPEDRPSSRLK